MGSPHYMLSIAEKIGLSIISLGESQPFLMFWWWLLQFDLIKVQNQNFFGNVQFCALIWTHFVTHQLNVRNCFFSPQLKIEKPVHLPMIRKAEKGVNNPIQFSLLATSSIHIIACRQCGLHFFTILPYL